MSKELGPRMLALLPVASVAKYNLILEALFAAGAALKAAYDTELDIADRMRDVRFGKTGPEDENERKALLSALEEQHKIARQRAERARAPFNSLASICDNMRETLSDRLRADARPFRSNPISPARTSDPSQEIEKIRKDIAVLCAEAAKVSSAPKLVADVKRHISETVNQIAARGEPQVSTSTNLRTPTDLAIRLGLEKRERGYEPGDTSYFFVWLMRDEIIEKLNALADQKRSPDAISDQERTQSLAKISARRLQLERREEAIILFAESNGLTIARRKDVNPYVILEIEDGQ